MIWHATAWHSMTKHGFATAVQSLSNKQIKIRYAAGLAVCFWWHRELQERLRSLVGGAITCMTRERACKDHIADLEHQLQRCKVSLSATQLGF